MNIITEILDIKDSGIKVLTVKETTSTKTVTIEKEITYHFCPVCGCRMYSKGIYTRHVNHPIMQDGLRLILEIRQRKWQCSNPECRNFETDEFSFVDKRRRNTNLSDILIVEAFRNPANSVAQIARMHNVSDSHVMRTFAKYVNLEFFEECTSELSESLDSINLLEKENYYLTQFISFKKLENEYDYFKENAHPADDPDNPFPPLVL